MGIRRVGVGIGRRQDRVGVFSGRFCGSHGYAAASLLACTVQCLRRRIDRVLLAAGGEAAEDGRLSRGPDHMSRCCCWST